MFLLNRMGQLMGEQPAPTRRAEVSGTTQRHMGADGKGTGAQLARGIDRQTVGVHADPTEVVAKRRLHGGADVGRERPATTVQSLLRERERWSAAGWIRARLRVETP